MPSLLESQGRENLKTGEASKGGFSLPATRSTWGQASLRDRISLVNTDTIAIIVAILGVGLALWRAIASIRQDVDSRHKDIRQDVGSLRQDLAELRQEMRADIAALNSRIDTLDSRFTSRIDALYQALFSHKNPAA